MSHRRRERRGELLVGDVDLASEELARRSSCRARFARFAGLLLLVVIAACTASRSPRSTPPADPAKIEQEHRFHVDGTIEAELERERRGFAAAEPILVAGGPLCSRRAPSVGARFASLADFPPPQRDFARSTLDRKEATQVIQVVPRLGASDAGLLEGDFIRKVNGIWPRSGARVLGLLHESGPNQFEVTRDGRTWTVEVESLGKCDYSLVYRAHRHIQAFSNDRRTIITSGLMHLLEDDREMAMVVAHEIAHNVLGHRRRKVINLGIGKLRGALLSMATEHYSDADARGLGAGLGAHIDGLTRSPEFEREADYVGLYLFASAGFEIEPGVWSSRAVAVHDAAVAMSSPVSTDPQAERRAEAMVSMSRDIRRRMDAGDLPRVLPTISSLRLAPADPSM